ncbi:hypothetical protein FQA39_LY09051 [Lamprigera yunnana]|nr:hypothetical protein FQA39_LY09051 [Lamprigera yunnana]
MDVDYIESCPIKSEIIVQETFSYCENYEDNGIEELKTEPVDIEKSFECDDEDNLVEPADVNQYICNECNFVTTEKDPLIQHLNIIKNTHYFCKE